MNAARAYRQVLLGWGALAVACAACADSRKRPNGDTCDASAQCESGLCYIGQCLDPSGDEDGDGLANAVEATLGSDPHNDDSDGDGLLDGAEVDTGAGGAVVARDTDGDGKPDVIESAKADADGDCLVDQADADDLHPAAGACDPPVVGWPRTTASVAAARVGWCAVAAGSKVVISSGLDANVDPPDVGDVDIYDVVAGRWDRVQFPTPHSRLSCLGGTDAAYFSGGNRETPGGDPLNAVVRFDPSNNSFATAFTYDVGRFDQALALCGTRLISAGGTYLPQNPGSFASTARVDLYDRQTQARDTATLSQPRGFMASAVIGGEAFFAGGVEQRLLTQFTTEAYATDVIDIYDCAVGTWRTDKLPHAHKLMSPHAATLGTRTYFSGGRAYAAAAKIDPSGSVAGDAGTVGILDVYDAETKGWSSLTIPRVSDGPDVLAPVAGRWLAAAVTLASGPAVPLYDAQDERWSMLGDEHDPVYELLVVSGKLVVVKQQDGQLMLDLFTPPG